MIQKRVSLNSCDMATQYDKYISKQLQNPEFRELYARAKEKVKLQIQLEKLREDIKQGKKPVTLLRQLNRLSDAVSKVIVKN
jgi:DNA invertase Pin-like site-specific DNA recombinase